MSWMLQCACQIFIFHSKIKNPLPKANRILHMKSCTKSSPHLWVWWKLRSLKLPFASFLWESSYLRALIFLQCFSECCLLIIDPGNEDQFIVDLGRRSEACCRLLAGTHHWTSSSTKDSILLELSMSNDWQKSLTQLRGSIVWMSNIWVQQSCLGVLRICLSLKPCGCSGCSLQGWGPADAEQSYLMSSLEAKMGDLLCSARARESLGRESMLVTCSACFKTTLE